MTDDVVATVVAAFQAVGVRPGGADDSFFQLGGDSLAASRVLANLNGVYSIRIPFAEMYRDSTPASLAGVIQQLRATPRPRIRSIGSVARRRRRAWFPLAMSQEALYTMDALTRGAGLFNAVGLARFAGDIDPEAVRAAVADTVRRQSALRLVFSEQDGRPVQRFTGDVPEVEVRDLRGRGERALRNLIRRERLTGFDLHAGPPTRFVLARTADDSWTLVSTVHHIVFDGVSQGMYLNDLTHAYACRMGEGTPAPALGWDYADFAEWQHDTLRGERLQAHLDAIRASLGRGAAPRLAPGQDGAARFLVRSSRFAVPREDTRKLRELAASCDTTPFVAAVTALLGFVADRTGDPRPAVAVQAANRSLDGTEEMVGCFANTVLVAVDNSGSAGPVDRVLHGKRVVSEALRHEEMPLEPALRMLGERDPGGPDEWRLPEIGFALQPPRWAQFDVPDGTVSASYAPPDGDAVDPTSFSLVLELFEEHGALEGLLHRRMADWPDEAFADVLAGLSDALARTGSGNGEG